jgi:membrane protease YdiL (CAAX protease family)
MIDPEHSEHEQDAERLSGLIPAADPHETENARAPVLEAYGSRPSSRVPNVGHAAIFLSFAFLVLLLSQLLLIAPQVSKGNAVDMLQPKRQLAAMGVAYVSTLGFCFLVFPLFWRRGFLVGVHWDGAKALRLAGKLVPLGIALGLLVQAISSLIPMPKSIPMDDFFRSVSDVWLVTAFGTLLAPLFEELCFRGFLLPAFAIAFDWIGPALKYLVAFSGARAGGDEPPRHFTAFRESAAAGLGEGVDNLSYRSRGAVIAASLVTSLLFALLHAEQLAHAWGALSVLFCVSLVLTAVRIRTRSLACSTMVHACYNLSVFLTLFVATGGYRHLEKMNQ